MFIHWFKSKNEIFKFYCDYKLLSFEKFYNDSDYKEVITLILYLINIMSIINEEDKNEENKIKIDSLVMKINEFNAYKINDNKYINTLTLEKINENEKDNKDYNKLAIFNLNSNKNYSLIDIIDENYFKRYDNKYEIKTNRDLYFVPLKNIDTVIYSFNIDEDNKNSEKTKIKI